MIIAVSILLASCGKNKEEKMLTNYLGKGMLKRINVNIDDTDFKIISIKKDSDITSSDSANIIKNKLADYLGKKSEQVLIDTLSFKYMKDLLNGLIRLDDTLINLYQKSMILAMKSHNYSYKYEAKNKRNKSIDNNVKNKSKLLKIEQLERKYNSYSKIPEKILSTKYKANYSITNPMLKVKQTFDKVYYTNNLGTEFLGTID